VSFLTTATRRYYDDLAVRSNYCINPGWIDLRGIDAYRAAHSRAELRAGLGLCDGDLLVVNVASVCERKGQTIFARAVDLLWRRDPALAARTHCLMIGGRNTRYDGELAALLHLLQRPHLEVRPETPDVYAAYNAADERARDPGNRAFGPRSNSRPARRHVGAGGRHAAPPRGPGAGGRIGGCRTAAGRGRFHDRARDAAASRPGVSAGGCRHRLMGGGQRLGDPAGSPAVTAAVNDSDIAAPPPTGHRWNRSPELPNPRRGHE
jgi:hypothetical protein